MMQLSYSTQSQMKSTKSHTSNSLRNGKTESSRCPEFLRISSSLSRYRGRLSKRSPTLSKILEQNSAAPEQQRPLRKSFQALVKLSDLSQSFRKCWSRLRMLLRSYKQSLTRSSPYGKTSPILTQSFSQIKTAEPPSRPQMAKPSGSESVRSTPHHDEITNQSHAKEGQSKKTSKRSRQGSSKEAA